MDEILYVFAASVRIFIDILIILMFIRVLFQFIPSAEGESVFENFVFGITEVIIFPMRILCSRSETISALPIDIPFMLTSLCLFTISLFL